MGEQLSYLTGSRTKVKHVEVVRLEAQINHILFMVSTGGKREIERKYYNGSVR